MRESGKMNAAQSQQPGRSILIVLIAGIGDLVLASPSLRALRNGYPDAELHLLTSAEAAPLAGYYPYIDHVYSFPIRQLRNNKKYLLDMARIVSGLRKTRFALILNLYRVCSFSGAAKMGMLFGLLRGERKLGHDRCGFGIFLDQSVPAGAFEGRHVVKAMADIATLAGGIQDDWGTEVFWDETITTKWEELLTATTGEIVIGINPGGDREDRRWPPDRFVAVAERLMERFKARVIILGGPTDRDIAAYITGKIKYKATNLAGEISLSALPFLVSRLDLLITNDSGPMHIAAATKTPLVALFGPEDPTLFGPYADPELCRVLYKGGSDFAVRKKDEMGSSLLNMITTEEVLIASGELLELRKIKYLPAIKGGSCPSRKQGCR